MTPESWCTSCEMGANPDTDSKDKNKQGAQYSNGTNKGGQQGPQGLQA